MLKDAVSQAKLGRDAQVGALKRLDDQARQLERTATGQSFDAFVAKDAPAPPCSVAGSVFGWEADLTASAKATKA